MDFTSYPAGGLGPPLISSLDHQVNLVRESNETTGSNLFNRVRALGDTLASSVKHFIKKPKAEKIAVKSNQTSEKQLQAEEKKIRNNLTRVGDWQKHLTELEQNAQTASTSQAMIASMQWWVADVILIGGAITLESTLPIFLQIPEGPQASFLTKFETGIDLLAATTGLVGLVYKENLLKALHKELKFYRSKIKELNPTQIKQLEKLEKVYKYQVDLFKSEEVEQHLRTHRSALYLSNFITSLAGKTPFLAALTSGLEAVISGINTAWYGLYFYHTYKDLQSVKKWSGDFASWLQKHTFISIDFRHLETTVDPGAVGTKKQDYSEKERNAVNNFLVRRNGRSKKRDNKIETLAITDEIIERITHFKLPKLYRTIERQPVFTDANAFRALIQKEAGIILDQEIAEAIFKIHNEFVIGAEQKKQQLTRLLEAGCKKWVESHRADALKFYTETQSMLDPIIKGALAEMAKKKHEIEKKILNFKNTDMGTRFTASAAIFGVVTTLAIIGFLTAPVGGVGFIFLALSMGSLVLLTGLIGGGYYFSYRLKPESTMAALKGTYLRLFFYQIMDKVQSLKESIDSYVSKIYRHQRNETANKIEHVVRVNPSVKEEGDKKIATAKQNKIWKDKADALQEELKKLAWKDFATQAGLWVEGKAAKPLAQKSADQTYDTNKAIKGVIAPFDTLDALVEALSQADLDLLNPETKELLEKYLGIDINFLKEKMGTKDSSAVKELIRNFFNLDDVMFAKFVAFQNIKVRK